MGNPGFAIPLREGCALTLPRAGVWGNQVPPWSRETVMRMAHHAAMPMPWERGRPARATAPRARRRPPPGPSPTGGGHPAPPPSGGRNPPHRDDAGQHRAGTRRLPPAGGGWEGGRTRRTMVTAAVHAAAPHTDGMKTIPGRAAPSQTLPAGGLRPHPPAGRGVGKPGFPTPLLQQSIFTLESLVIPSGSMV